MVKNFRKQCYIDLKSLSILKRMDIPQANESKTIVDWLDTAATFRGDPVQQLEYKDYVNILSSRKGEGVVCRNGRLYRKSSLKTDDIELVTAENYRMVDHLVDLMLMREDTKSEVAKVKSKKNIMRRLGVDLDNKVSGPLSMEKLLEIMKESNSKLSKVDNVLLNGESNSVESQVAKSIDNLLGSAFSAGKKSTKEYEQEQKGKIQAIFAYQSDNELLNHFTVANFLPGEMDFLIAGQLQTVRDRVFDSVMRIYRRKEAMGLDKQQLQATLTGIDYRRLLKLAISEVIVDLPSSAEFMSAQIARYEEAQILGDDEEGKINRKAINSLRIEPLLVDNIENVRSYAYSHLKEWSKITTDQTSYLQREKLNKDKRKEKKTEIEKDNYELLVNGLNAYCTIADCLSKLNDLTKKGIAQGLTNEEAELMAKHGQQIDNIFSANRKALFNFKQQFKSNTAIAAGLNKLFKEKEDKIISYDTCAKKVAAALVVEQPLEEKPETFGSVFSEEAAAREAMKELDEKTRKVVGIFVDEIQPQDFIKTPGDENSTAIVELYNAMKDIAVDNPQTVKFAGVTMRFSVSEDEILTLTVNQKNVELPYTVEYWKNRFTEVIFDKFDMFDSDTAIEIVKLKAKGDQSRLQESKVLDGTIYRKFIADRIGIKKERLENLDVSDFTALLILACEYRGEEIEQLKIIIDDTLEQNEKSTYINSREITSGLKIEKLKRLEKQKEINQNQEVDHNKKEQNQEVDLEIHDNKKEWNKEEHAALDFMSEFVFSKKTWKEYENDDASKRFIRIVADNAKGFEALIKCEDSLRKTFNGTTYFDEAAELIISFAKKFKVYLNKNLPETTVEEISQNKNLLKAMKFFETEDGKNVDSKLKEAVTNVSNKISDYMTDSMKEDKVKRDYDTLYSMSSEQIITKNLTGGEGTGAFNKLVMSNYVRDSIKVDKRYMLACALKNAPKYEAKMKESVFNGRFISGYLKGAGPMLHKMMQGIPMNSLDSVMQEAIKDSRSNLMGLDDEVIKFHYEKLKDSSNGQIDSITHVKQLGAASVGVTVLAKVKKTGAKKAEEKVIKIRRPDIINRLNREYKNMKVYAHQVDAKIWAKKTGRSEKDYPNNMIGSIEKDIMDKYQAYIEETDLTAEAENIKKGKVYDGLGQDIRAMKLDTTMPKSGSAIVLEKAKGVTVNQFMSDKSKELKDLRKKYQEDRQKDSAYGELKALGAFREDLIKKQQYLFNLTQKWLEEALFGTGYFHGDMHSGNIMIDENGVTVIDFGNAHTLSPNEQIRIIRLLAASMQNVDDKFKDNFKELLSGASKEKFIAEENQDKIDDIIHTIIKKNDNPGSKMLAIVSELKNAGFDVPAQLEAFINSLTRITVALLEYDKLVEKVDDAINEDLHYENSQSFYINPGARMMSKIKEYIDKEKVKADKDNKIAGLENEVDNRYKKKDFDAAYLVKYLKGNRDSKELSELLSCGQYEKTHRLLNDSYRIYQGVFSASEDNCYDFLINAVACILSKNTEDNRAKELFKAIQGMRKKGITETTFKISINENRNADELEKTDESRKKLKDYELYDQLKDVDPLGMCIRVFGCLEHIYSDDINKGKTAGTGTEVAGRRMQAWKNVRTFLSDIENINELKKLNSSYKQVNNDNIESIRTFLDDYIAFIKRMFDSIGGEDKKVSEFFASTINFIMYADEKIPIDELNTILSEEHDISDDEQTENYVQSIQGALEERDTLFDEDSKKNKNKSSAAEDFQKVAEQICNHLDGAESFEDSMKKHLMENKGIEKFDGFIENLLADEDLADDMKNQLNSACNALKNFDTIEQININKNTKENLINNFLNALKDCTKARANIIGKIAIESKKSNDDGFEALIKKYWWNIYFKKLEKRSVISFGYPYWNKKMSRAERYQKKQEFIRKKTDQMGVLIAKLNEIDYRTKCNELYNQLANYNKAEDKARDAMLQKVSSAINNVMEAVFTLLDSGFTLQEAAEIRKAIETFESNTNALNLCEIINKVNDTIKQLFKDTYYTLEKDDVMVNEGEKLEEQEDVKGNSLLTEGIRRSTELSNQYNQATIFNTISSAMFGNLNIVNPLKDFEVEDYDNLSLEDWYNPSDRLNEKLKNNKEYIENRKKSEWCTKRKMPKSKDRVEKRDGAMREV